MLRFSYATDPGWPGPAGSSTTSRSPRRRPARCCSRPTSRPGAVRTTRGLQRRLPGGPRRQQCTKGWKYVDASGGPRGPRLLPGDARPVGLRPRRQRRDRPRPDRLRARPARSSTPTRRTATATPAPTTRRRSRRSTRPRAGLGHPEPVRRGVHRRCRRVRFTDSGEGHTDNYSDPAQTDVDPRYADVANPWRFRYDCLDFQVLRWRAAASAPVGADGDLTGRRQVRPGAGCATFDYEVRSRSAARASRISAPNLADTRSQTHTRTATAGMVPLPLRRPSMSCS